MYRIKSFLILFLLFNLSACFDDPGEPNNQRHETSSAYYTENNIRLTNLLAYTSNAPTTQVASDTAVNCTYIADIYSANGSCITPVNVIAFAEQAHLLRENGNVPGGTRILGESEYRETPGEIFGGHEFDLSQPSSLVTNNTLSDQYPFHEQYDTLTISTAYYKVKFPVTLSSGTKFVTMLLAKYGQPFSSSNAISKAIDECGLSGNEITASRFVNADLLPGMSFNRGDYLFCVKDTDTDSCSASDFQWLDTKTNQLTSTRPETPKVSQQLVNTEIECNDEGGGRVSFDFGPFGFYAAIDPSKQFKLWSDFSHGEFSQQWPDATAPQADETTVADPTIAGISPYYIYYYEDCSNNVCENLTQQGTDLDVNLTFDMSQMVLVEDITPDQMLALSNIGEVLSKTHVKSQWAFDQKSINNVIGYDANDMVGLTVLPEITLTGDATTPPDAAIILCSELNENEVSENSCDTQ